MKKIIFLLALVLFTLTFSPVAAIDCEGNIPEDRKSDVTWLQAYIDACQTKIGSLHQEQQTLKAVISLITSQINLTQAQIRSTITQIAKLERDIGTLSSVISDLDIELEKLTQVFISRVQENYKKRQNNPFLTLFSSGSLANLRSRIKYFEVAQKRDQIIIHELKTARLNYDQQKVSKEEKQTEIISLQTKMENQKKILGVQQSQKSQLLTETQNSEKMYQEYLSKAVAELAAIESIIAGLGSETVVGGIEPGQKIASIIPAASACSTGPHLHFEVARDQSHQNPANFLKNISVIWNNDPDGQFSFTGSWNWPLNEPIRITQGYGYTAYSSRYANDQHTGVDMTSQSNYDVKAVQKGTLYRGSIPCGGGTLKYVHVDHADDDYHTYYLHVNYF